MELLQLAYFCESAKNENFSRTAEKYGVPTSSVSQSIHRLEEELQTELFTRGANRIRLSSNGRAFYVHVKDALGLLDDARASLTDAGQPSGELRLLIGTNRRIATLAIERYKNAYPEVSFVIHHGTLDTAFDYDFILTDAERAPLGYEGDVVLKERILLAARRDLLPSSSECVSTLDLSRMRFVSMTQRNDFYRTSCEVFRRLGVTPNVVIQTDDPFYVRKYVELGLGATLVPEISWRGYFSGDIVFFDIGAFDRSTYLYSKKGRYPSGAKCTFEAMLRDAFLEERRQ